MLDYWSSIFLTITGYSEFLLQTALQAGNRVQLFLRPFSIGVADWAKVWIEDRGVEWDSRLLVIVLVLEH
jgi:hypothetical protein